MGWWLLKKHPRSGIPLAVYPTLMLLGEKSHFGMAEAECLGGFQWLIDSYMNIMNGYVTDTVTDSFGFGKIDLPHTQRSAKASRFSVCTFLQPLPTFSFSCEDRRVLPGIQKSLPGCILFQETVSAEGRETQCYGVLFSHDTSFTAHCKVILGIKVI